MNFTRITFCGMIAITALANLAAQQPSSTKLPALSFQQSIITTIAGNGTSGYIGDGASAAAAEVTTGIRGIAADTAGDVFFVDDTSGTIRVIYEGGTVAATLVTAENPTVASPQLGFIYAVAGKEGSTGTPVNGALATSSLIKPGAGLSLDTAGDIYYNDIGTNKIYVIYAGGAGTTGTNLIALEAGVTTPQLGYIYAVAGGSATGGYTGDGSLATASNVELHGVNDMKFDAAGDMYIVDQGNNAIRVVNAKTGIISTFAGGASGAGTAGASGLNGPATTALLNAPYGIALDAGGDLYIADKSNHEIKMVYEGSSQAAALLKLVQPTVTPAVGDIYLVAGNGSTHYPYGALATSSALNSPTMVALDAAGNIYIADNSYNVVLEVNAMTGIMYDIGANGTAGFSGDGGAAVSGEINGIRCLAVDAAGRIYLTDSVNARIREMSQGILTFVGEPVGVTSAPVTITLMNTGNAELDFTGGTPLFGGTDASEFALDPAATTNTCSLGPLQPGASCNLAITYTPNHSGTSNATLTYKTNGVLATQVITLIGLLTPTTTGLAASATMTYPGQSVTLTATVSASGTGVPTGTVTFLQGATVLQAVTLPSSGVATYTVGPLVLGAYTYTVKYSGDTNYAASTSNAVVIDVDSFTVSATPSTISVTPGQATPTTLTIIGQGPASQVLTFSCTAPAILGCAFTPISTTLTSAGTSTVTVSVAAVATTSSLHGNSPTGYSLALMPLAALLSVLVGRRRRSKVPFILAIICLLPVATLCGCGENNIGKALGASTQTVVVNVSGQGSQALTQSVSLTVNVQ